MLDDDVKLSAGDDGWGEMDSDLVLAIIVSMIMPGFRAAEELYVDVVLQWRIYKERLLLHADHVYGKNDDQKKIRIFGDWKPRFRVDRL